MVEKLSRCSTVLATARAVVPALETALAASIHRLGVLLGQTSEALETELAAVAPIPAAPPVVPVGLPSERQLAAATANIVDFLRLREGVRISARKCIWTWSRLGLKSCAATAG